MTYRFLLATACLFAVQSHADSSCYDTTKKIVQDGHVSLELLNDLATAAEKDHAQPKGSTVLLGDFTAKPRLISIDLSTGTVSSYLTDTSMGSDPNNTGRLQKFSNAEGSHATPGGLFKIQSKRTVSVKGEVFLGLDGLEPGNNNTAKRRAGLQTCGSLVASQHARRSWGSLCVDSHAMKQLSANVAGALLFNGIDRHKIKSDLKSIQRVTKATSPICKLLKQASASTTGSGPSAASISGQSVGADDAGIAD